jgi:hypothetical protein
MLFDEAIAHILGSRSFYKLLEQDLVRLLLQVLNGEIEQSDQNAGEVALEIHGVFPNNGLSTIR